MSYRRKHIAPKIRSLRKRKRLIQQPLFWVFMITLVVIGGIAYLVLFSSSLQVASINISGNEKVLGQDIEDVVWGQVNKKIIALGPLNLWSKSILLVDLGGLQKKMLNTFPQIQEVLLTKKLPHEIILHVKERKSFAVFCYQECFFIDSKGVIFEVVHSIPQDMVVMRKESDIGQIALGQHIVDEGIINIIAKVESNLKNNFQISTIEVWEGLLSYPLVFTTSEGWKIYFDSSSDINLQITKMNALLQDEISLDARKKLEYIYLQYEDRAYYK